MVNEKVEKIIDVIKYMDEKDKLRLAICMNDSVYTNLKYDKKEMLEKFDKRLKEVDEEYRTSIVDFSKYKLVMLTMAKIVELDVAEQNKVALVLFNGIRK